jgi:hypothetical protein
MKKTNKIEEFVLLAQEFTDEEVRSAIDGLLASHRLAINPQIIVQLIKLQDPKPKFEDVATEKLPG